MTTSPLDSTDLNRLQRWYFAWAKPRYACMHPDNAAEAEALDRFLYSRRAAGLWLGLMGAVIGSTAGLAAAGFAPGWALVGSVVVYGILLFQGLAAWMQPDKVLNIKWIRKVLLALLLAYLGALLGFMVGRFERKGREGMHDLGPVLLEAARQATPILLVMVFGVALLTFVVARLRRQRMTRELAGLRLVQERDAAALQATEARLQLLSAQIQPHFIFNTLAAVQHWVDTGDARAADMLRALSGFLRGSTELLGRESVSLAQEAEVVRDYLRIMQARLGPRLQVSIEIEPRAGQQLLPPGLMLTLVENAIEHGISPAMHGGELTIEAQTRSGGFELQVRNTGHPLDAAWSEGVGLANCRQRLAHRFGATARLALDALPDGTRAQIEIHDPASSV